MTPTDADKIACLRRELAMRRRVYPRQVGRGQMTQAEADREIGLIEAILEDYAPAESEAGQVACGCARPGCKLATWGSHDPGRPESRGARPCP